MIADWVREGEPQQLSRALPLTVGTGAAERLQLRVDGEIAAAEDGWVPLELRASTSLTHSLVVEILNEEGAGLPGQGVSMTLTDSDWPGAVEQNPCPVVGDTPDR